MPGRSCTLRAKSPAMTIATARTNVPETLKRGLPSVAPVYDGSSMSSADSADTMSDDCSAWELPIHGTRTKLVAIEPTMAPTVFAAYTPPASRAASCSVDATLASASGKLAPHSIAPGRTTHRQRTRSNWYVYQGVVTSDGLIGQYGSDSVS